MRKLVLLTIMALSAVALVAYAATEVPENITIDGCQDAKSAVEFTHKAHFEYATCVDCHHTSEGLTAETVATMEVPTCGSCHNAPEKEGTPVCADKSLKTNPYHINCVTCHKADKKENAETKAPTKCSACHPKEK